MYDKRTLLIFCDKEESLTGEFHLTCLSIEVYRVSERGIIIKMYARTIIERQPELLVMPGNQGGGSLYRLNR